MAPRFQSPIASKAGFLRTLSVLSYQVSSEPIGFERRELVLEYEIEYAVANVAKANSKEKDGDRNQSSDQA